MSAPMPQMPQMPQMYVVGGQLPTPRPAAAPTSALVVPDAEAELDDVLARIDEHLALDAEAGPEPVPAEMVAALEEVCGRPDALVELASLQRRVDDGVVTWDEVWTEPWAHDGAMHAVAAVLHHVAA